MVPMAIAKNYWDLAIVRRHDASSAGSFVKTFSLALVFCLTCSAGAQQPLTLQEAIELARTHRATFEAARLRLLQANLSRRALGAFPTTRLFVGYTSDRETGGSDQDLVLVQPIDIFGRTSAARSSGNALVLQAEAGFRQIAADVQSDVVNAYIEAAASAELARSAASVQETLTRLYDATRLRVQGGVSPGVQLTRVSLDLGQAELRTEQRQAELRANLQRLATLVGSKEPLTVANGFPELPILQVDDTALIRQRPDLLLLAADVSSAESDARIARLEGMPELEIQGRRTPWQQAAPVYGLRLQLSIPLFDSGRVRTETRAANAKAEAARKALADSTRLAVGEIVATRIEVESAKSQVSRYETLVVTARQLVERLRPGLTEQATTLLEVIDATRALRELEEAFVEARQRQALAQARFLHATGQILGVSR